jgi:hypothetical protein
MRTSCAFAALQIRFMDDGGLGDFWGAPEENTAGICAVELEFYDRGDFRRRYLLALSNSWS